MPNALTLSAALRRRGDESLTDYFHRLEQLAESAADTRTRIQELTEQLREEEAAELALTRLTTLIDEVTVGGGAPQAAPAPIAEATPPAPRAALAEAPTPDPAPSKRQQITAHIASHPWQTVREVTAALEFSPKTVSAMMSTLKTTGVFQVHGGRYALTGTPLPETALEAEAPAPVVEAQPEAPAPEEEPAPAPAPVTPQPSTRAQVLEFMQRHDRVEFTPQRVAEELGASVAVVEAHLTALHRTGAVSASPQNDDGTRWFCWIKPEPVPEQSPSTPLPPIPAKLSTDEVSVFDALRREPEGLSKRVLATRLNWTGSRLDRVLNRLTQAAHVGPMGDRYRVFAQDLDAGAAD